MFQVIDWKIFLPAAFLVSIGSVVLTSVSPHSYPLHFFYIALALLAFIAFANIDFSMYLHFAPTFYAFSIITLLITLIFGSFTRGATRWIEIGPMTLQTSEVAKPFIVLFLAWILFREERGRKFIYTSLAALFPFVLVFVQPDLGSALIILAGFFGAVYFGGLPWKVILSGLVVSLVSLPFVWRILAGYQKDRIMTFIQPNADPLGTGYNAIQAIIAIGSGGFSGRGLGQGTQSQLLFLPERHTDFIFASIGEELGFLGAGLVLVLFSLLFARIIAVFSKLGDVFSRAFIGGVFFMVFFQASVNIGMNLGILPITGVPLPFVSSGGSSLLGMSITLGIVSSFARHLRSASI